MTLNLLILLGVLSVIQSLFLPGVITLKLIEFKGSWFQKIIYTVAISLILSFLLVILLVLIGGYKQIVVFGIFLLESVFAIWLFRVELRTPLQEHLKLFWENILGAIQDLFSTWGRVSSFSDVFRAALSFGAFLLSLSLLWWSLKLVNHYTGTVFDVWDAIVSWNRWAVSWAEGQIPIGTHNYPQLVPVHYSLSYIFLGTTSIQFFAKFIVLPMAFLILLMPFDLGIQTKQSGYFLAVILIYLLLKKMLILELTNGYVDGMMAFFALLAVYTLIKMMLEEGEREKRQLFFLGALFIGGGAMVKQPGIFIFALYPVWFYFGVQRYGFFKKIWQEKKLILTSFGISILLAVPWYVLKQIHFYLNLDTPHIGVLVEVSANNNHNVGWFRQIIDTISQFEIYLVLFPIIILTFFALKPLYRWLVVTLILPYPIMWALIASYDTRNLSIFIPIFGLVAGVAIEKLIDWSLSLWDFGKLKLWMVSLIIVIALTLGLVAKFPNEMLSEKQFELQSQLFSAKKNAMLYDLVEREGTEITILTSYPLRFLPGFNEVELYDSYKNYGTFIGKLENTQVDYLLVPEDVFIETQINDYLNGKIANGEYALVWEEKSWKYFKLLRVVK